MEWNLTLLSGITHNRLSDYYVAIFSWIKNKHIIITYSYAVSRVGQKNHNQNQNNKKTMAMAKPFDKAVDFGGLIGSRLQIVDAGSLKRTYWSIVI